MNARQQPHTVLDKLAELGHTVNAEDGEVVLRIDMNMTQQEITDTLSLMFEAESLGYRLYNKEAYPDV